MVKKISAAEAGLNVLKGWGVDTIYGIPSSTLGSLMDTIPEVEGIDFIQVRHEETGALAAVMQHKFAGKLAVAVGSGGPGASHLIQGIYDAKMDNTPFLAILGAQPHKNLNLDYFQELNQNTMYESPAVYNKRVVYAEQLPKVIDEAARTAVTRKGPAVVEVPVDFGWEEIDADSYYSSGPSHRPYQASALDQEDIDAAVDLLNQAERPVLFAGVGINQRGDLVEELSRKIKAPVIVSGKNYDAFDHDFEALMGSAGRVAWKPANEILQEADTLLFIGSNYPFAEGAGMFAGIENFIQIDIDAHKLGKRHKTDVAILGDAAEAVEAIIEKVDPVEDNAWWRANLKNAQNWRDYMTKLETKESGKLQLYQVYNAINKHTDEDAIYSIDIGNTTQTSVRHLHMNPKNMWRTSPLFATMGIAIPGGIAAKKEFPDRQVWNLIGDGAFNMSYPDVITNVQYNLPVINVVFENHEYGFIKNKYEETNEHLFGVDFTGADYAKIGEAQGALGLTVDRIEDVDQVIAEAVEANKAGKTVVVHAIITEERPIPVESLELDPRFHSAEDIQAFKDRYEAEDLKPFIDFLSEEGLTSKQDQA